MSMIGFVYHVITKEAAGGWGTCGLDPESKCVTLGTHHHILNCQKTTLRVFPRYDAVGLGPIIGAMSEEVDNDELAQQFYTAAQAMGGTGSESLDVLLQKGLYGSRMPSALKGKKAADAFQQAFDLIGGIPRLALWADKNPNAFFSLYSKLIPSSVKAEINGTIKIEAPWMNANRLSYRDSPQLIVDVTPSEQPAPAPSTPLAVPLKPKAK
jgi:hypothetical protein